MVVGTEDHLQAEQASRCQQGSDLSEECLGIAVTDRFEHLDGDDLVEPTSQIAVVAENHLDEIADVRRLDPFGGLAELLLTDGRRRDAATAGLGRMDGEAAPSATDLKHHVMGADLHLLAETLPLPALGFLKGEIRLVVVGRRVGHRRVEPELKEIVPEIVVLADVVAALGLAVGAKRVSDPVQRAQQVKETMALVIAGPDTGEVVAVEDEPGEGAGQVGGLPFPREIRLGKANRSEQDAAAVKIVIADRQLRVQFFTQPAEKASRSTRHGDLEFAASRPGKGIKDQLAEKFVGESHGSSASLHLSDVSEACASFSFHCQLKHDLRKQGLK